MDRVLNPAIGALQISEDDVFSHSTDIFSTVGKEISMLDGNDVIYYPTSLNSTGPYTFQIYSQGNKFMQLGSAKLWIKARVLQLDGTAMANTADVGLVNAFVRSFTEKIDIAIDGSEVSSLSNTEAHFKNYVESVLSYGFGSSRTHLTSGGFYLDSPYQFESNEVADNNGFATRKAMIAESGIFECIAPLQSDFLQQSRFFPPGMTLTITLNRASDSFLLKTGGEAPDAYKLEILGMSLKLRHVTLTDPVTLSLLGSLTSQTLTLPFIKTVVKRDNAPAGVTSVTIPNFVVGSLPKSLVFFLLPEGNEKRFHKNPYNFGHFNLNGASIRVNGKQYPSERFAPDFTYTTGAVKLYDALMENIGIGTDDESCLITPNLFLGGQFFMAFDLSPDRCGGFHNHTSKTGTIDLELSFSQPLATPLTVRALVSYDAILAINPKKESRVIY